MCSNHDRRPRGRHSAVAAAMLTVAGIVAADRPAAAQDVQPFVECVKLERRAGRVAIAYFGYTNSNPNPVTLASGTQENFFLPTPPDRGQPSVFEPGEHRFAFVVVLPAGSLLRWSLAGRNVVASDALPCSTYAIFKGDWSPSGGYLDGDVVRFNGAYYQGVAREVDPFSGLAAVTFTGTPEESLLWWHPIDPGRHPVMNLPGPAETNVQLSETCQFPRSARLTIHDPRVTPTSVVIVQYMGGNLLPALAADIKAGRFTAVGLPDKKFRYVVIN